MSDLALEIAPPLALSPGRPNLFLQFPFQAQKVPSDNSKPPSVFRNLPYKNWLGFSLSVNSDTQLIVLPLRERQIGTRAQKAEPQERY